MTQIETRITLGRDPYIGEKGAFFARPGVIAFGTIVDIRGDDAGVRIASIAVLGTDYLGRVPVDQYRERRDGVWRACSHSRGFNVAGFCFDCDHNQLPPVEEPQP